MYCWHRQLQRKSLHTVVASVIACMALISFSAIIGADMKSSIRSTLLSTNAGPPRVGISYGDTLTWLSDEELAATLDDAGALGAKWIRADLSWANIQPSSAEAYQWDRFDRVVSAVQKRGLTLLPIVAYTPPWARTAGCSSEKCPPANADQFAQFAETAAARYPGITTWEIWNEENSQVFWHPRPDPLAYANLLKVTAASIRKSNSAAQILIGGLSIANSVRGGMTPQDFLAVVARSGATEGADGVGLHPYTYPNLASHGGPWISALHSVRSAFANAGVPELPIWITEYGAPTGGGAEGTDHVLETRQAEMAADAVRTAGADEGVAALFWYTYQDSGSDPNNTESFYGLRRADGSKKPAYDAFRQAIAGSPG